MNLSTTRELLEAKIARLGEKLMEASQRAKMIRILNEARSPLERQFLYSHEAQEIGQTVPSRFHALLNRAIRARRANLLRTQQIMQQKARLNQGLLDRYYQRMRAVPESVGIRGALGQTIAEHPDRALLAALGVGTLGSGALVRYLYDKSKYGEFSKLAAEPEISPEEFMQINELFSSLGPSINQAIKYHTQAKHLSKQYQTLKEIYDKANPVKKIFYNFTGRNPKRVMKKMQQAEAMRNEAIGNAAGSIFAGGSQLADKYMSLRELEDLNKKNTLRGAIGGFAGGAALTGGLGGYYLYKRRKNNGSNRVPGTGTASSNHA